MFNKITLKEFKQAVKNGMKVLHLDCETSPALAYTHYIGSKVFIDPKQVKSPSQVMCVQYKWEGDKKARHLEWTRLATLSDDAKWDDSAMLEKVSELIDKADIIVGQNMDAFDLKVLNYRLMINKCTPIDNDNTIDILKLSRKSFRMLSHKLDSRVKIYTGSGKIKMEYQDWIDVAEAKVPVSRKMAPYGRKDVEDEQIVFYREFRYYKQFPAMVIKTIKSFLPDVNKKHLSKCNRCKSPLVNRGTRTRAGGVKIQEKQCTGCGKYSKEIL